MKKIFNIPLYILLTLGLALVSMNALIFAYVAEYFFNYKPCILCLYQRIPYFVVLVLGTIGGFFALRKRPNIAKCMLYLCGVAFFAGTVLSGFHTGVEQTWWAGTKACGGGALPSGASIAELKEYLTHQPIVRCDVPTWKLFGLSMTNYNFALSLFLAIITFFFTYKGSKK